MGKPTGFMEYDRQTAKAAAPKERIKHFNEFHTPLSKEEQQKQGARCMACGVPFCQSGMDIMGMTSGCPTIFQNLRQECVRHFVKRHVPVVIMARRCQLRKMNLALLNMHMNRVLQRQNRRKCALEKR